MQPAAIAISRPRQNQARWAWIVLAALFLHFLAMITPWDKILPAREPLPTPLRVPIQQMDPAQLDKIKRQWKEKGIVLPTSQEESPVAPKDARYFSDKNRMTDRETKGRQADVLPKQGAEAKQKGQEATPQAQAMPKLKDLGLPVAKDGIYALPKNGQKTAKKQGKSMQVQERADQSLLDPELIEGAENLLNTEQSIFYSYYSRLYQEIAPVWAERIKYTIYPQRILPGEYESQVDVVFDAKGNLVSIFFEKRSGIPDFDQAIIYAWKKIQRFPNPPSEKLDKRGQIHTGWTFHVSVGDGSQFQYAPPERVY